MTDPIEPPIETPPRAGKTGRNRFIGGAAAGFVVLITGLDLVVRFPDRNGAGGRERVAFHGVPVLDRPIAPADVPNHSPWPVVAAFAGTMVGGTIVSGAVWRLMGVGLKGRSESANVRQVALPVNSRQRRRNP